MSLLRQQAQKCLANQVTHKGLNAFIATENADAVLRSVEADSGTSQHCTKLYRGKD